MKIHTTAVQRRVHHSSSQIYWTIRSCSEHTGLDEDTDLLSVCRELMSGDLTGRDRKQQSGSFCFKRTNLKIRLQGAAVRSHSLLKKLHLSASHWLWTLTVTSVSRPVRGRSFDAAWSNSSSQAARGMLGMFRFQHVLKSVTHLTTVETATQQHR